MPLLPNPIERLLFSTTNQAPGPALDLWCGSAFSVVLAALRLRLFEALHLRCEEYKEYQASRNNYHGDVFPAIESSSFCDDIGKISVPCGEAKTNQGVSNVR